MPRLPKEPSPVELRNIFTQALRYTAQNPSITAYTPQDYQIAFHSSTKREKLFIGGNRSGKTVGGGTESVWWLTGLHPYRSDIPRPPIAGRICAVDFDNGVELIVKPEVKKWIPPSALINGSWEDSFNRQLRMLTLANGSTVEFRSYDQDMDKFAGTSRHFIWFDEEPPENIFNENLLRLVDVGGSWWLTMTPLIDMTWVEDRLYDPWQQGTYDAMDVFEVNTTQNKYVLEENLDLALRGMSEEEKAARKSGTFIRHGGLIYKPLMKDTSIIDDITTDPDQWRVYQNTWGHFAMMDHGLTNPACFLFACYNGDGDVIVYDEIYEAGLLVEEIARLYHQKCETLGIKPSYIMGDPSIANSLPVSSRSTPNPTSVHVLYAEQNVFIGLANNDVLAGISRVQSYIAAGKLRFTRRCHKTLWELGRYRWEKFVSSKIAIRRNEKETPLKRNDHAMDALKYGITSMPELSAQVDTKAIPMVNSSVTGTDHIEFDWELYAQNPENEETDNYDEVLGSGW